jgi:putative thiamine transport system ATP-binding protein
MLEVSGAFARIAERTLYEDVAFKVAPGECLTILGRSGSGKSTLLSFIAGTTDPGLRTGGILRLGGRRIDMLRPEKRRIGIVFQDAGLFPHMTGLKNLLFAMPRGGGRDERRRRGLAALEQVSAAHLAGVLPGAMSGGERARIAVARTLIAAPEAVLLDEPFSALDRELRGEIRELTFGLVKKRGLPCVLVTHDEEDAGAAGARRLLIGR